MVDRRGRSGRAWQRLRDNLKAQRSPCWLCQQPIDYDLAWPDVRSFSADHVRPRSTFPEGAEDPSNLRAAHLGCNSSRHADDAKPALGATSRSW